MATKTAVAAPASVQFLDAHEPGQKIILVLQQGFVFTGLVANPLEHPTGTVCITDAACIRSWGTDRGLGQIALSGPTTSTVLDPVGTLTCPSRSEVFRLPCVV